MKKTLLSATALLLISNFINCNKDNVYKNTDCIPQNLQANILAFYPFSNGSLFDYSGNSHHLNNITTAKPCPDRLANDSCSYEFKNKNAVVEFLKTDDTGFLNALTGITISLWYEPLDSTRDVGDFEVLLSRGEGKDCPDKYGQWSVSLYDCRKAVFGRNNSVWDNNIGDCNTNVIMRTGSWHHLCATWDKASNELSIYRDGILQETELDEVGCGSSSLPIQDIGDLFLGPHYYGRLDDVIIFDKALDITAIQALSSMQPCCNQ